MHECKFNLNVLDHARLTGRDLFSPEVVQELREGFDSARQWHNDVNYHS